MKKQVTGIAVALFATAALATSASAEYYIDIQQDGNTIKTDVVAEGATLSAIEFIVSMPEGVEIIDSYKISGAMLNRANGHFAWAGIETPTDGTVMYSVTFTVKDNYEGELSIIPVEGFKQDLSDTLTVPLSYKEADNESSSGQESSDTSSEVPSDNSEIPDTSIPDSETSDATDENGSNSDTSVNKDENGINSDTGIPGSETSDTTDGNANNPDTGIALGVVPIGIVGAAAITLARKNKKD